MGFGFQFLFQQLFETTDYQNDLISCIYKMNARVARFWWNWKSHIFFFYFYFKSESFNKGCIM